MKTMKTFGEVMRKKREAKGLSRRQLADMVGVKYQTIFNIETGFTTYPQFDVAARIAEALDSSLSYFVSELAK